MDFPRLGEVPLAAVHSRQTIEGDAIPVAVRRRFDRGVRGTQWRVDELSIGVFAPRLSAQACLREEEWIEADREFYIVIRDGLEHYRARGRQRMKGKDGPER